MFLGLKSKLYAAGAVILGVVAFFIKLKVVTSQRDRAKEKSETLQATVSAERKKKEIIKEEKKILRSKRREIRKEVKKKDEEFKGLDNLSDSNDF